MQDIKYKTVSSASGKILARFMAQGKTWFSLADAYTLFDYMSENQVRVQIKRMVDAGLLMRIREGIYYLIPYEYNAETYMPEWHLLAAPLAGQEHYIGYYSALQIHQLITQPSLKEQLVVSKQIKPTETKIKGIRFQFIYHNAKHFFGHKKIWIDSVNRVFCSDLEKTLVDCLYKPDYAGGSVEIAKAIFMSRKKINFDRLLEYVIRFNSQAVIKRLGYLLELLNIDTPIVDALQQRRSPSISPLDTEMPLDGKIISRWNIRQNIDVATIKSALFT
jgi:predicted transcriptional regulator of viral defense system